MSNKEFSYLYSQNITEFITITSEYCTFLENVHRFSKKDVLLKAQRILPLLYIKTLLIPPVESLMEEQNESFVTEELWFGIHDAIKKKLGYHDEYPEVFDPLTKEQEFNSIASIADNLTDIYQDIKNFVVQYNMGTEEIMNDALWECKLNFEEHWGQKLTNALRAMHAVIVGEDNLEEDEEKNQSYDASGIDDIDTSNWIFTQRQANSKK